MVPDLGLFALVALGLVLGLRHGVDWDHIAAIADITGSLAAGGEPEGGGSERSHPGSSLQAVSVRHGAGPWRREGRARFALAMLYALGHASVVVLLGLLAIWAGSLLPEWLDPLVERIVGITLLALGIWIFYSLWRYGRSFRLQSRWMLLFSLVGRGWALARGKLFRHPVSHSRDVDQYGKKTAFAIGMIHGVGAETGSQALLLASAAGATNAAAGSLMLLSFAVGLFISNSFVAALSTFGFVSSRARRNAYLAIGVVAGVFSLVVGGLFVAGQGAALPDLQEVLDFLFGPALFEGR